MRKVWIAIAVCGGAAGFLAWGSSQPSQAALMVTGNQSTTSMVDQVKARKKAKAAPAQCNNFLLMKCCTAKGKETCTPGPM